MIAGPLSCGKTVFTTRLLLDNPDLYRSPTNAIRHCYGSWQHGFELLKQCNVQFRQGVPDRSKITVIYLCKDLFPNGKFSTTISRNAHYIIAFKNPRDQLRLRNLLQQSFPTQFREVLDTFCHVTNERPFAYMFLDLHPASRDDQRILSHALLSVSSLKAVVSHQTRQTKHA